MRTGTTMHNAKHLVSSRRHLIIACAAVLGLIPLTAQAQYRTNNTGRANDASNEVGSGGINGNGAQDTANNRVNTYIPNGNDVVNRNVTGLFGFQGRVPYADPTQFTGRLPVEPSLTLQQISGGGMSPNGSYSQQPQVFYNVQKQGNAVPPGFVVQPYTGTYVPAPPPTMQPQDARLGNPLDLPVPTMPQLTELGGEPGPVDTLAIVTPDYLLNLSPLYGSRSLQLNDLGSSVLSSTPLVSPEGSYGEALSNDQILQYRLQLNKNLVGGAGQQSPGTNGQGTNGQGTNPQGANGQQLQAPLIGAKPLTPTNLGQSSALSTPRVGAPLGTGLSTGQYSLQQLPPPPPPEVQSPAYAQLRQRLEQYNQMHPQNQADADKLFQAELKLRRQYEQNSLLPGQTPGGPTPPGQATPPAPAAGGQTTLPPLDIGPVSGSVNAPGLHDLLKQGEDLARKQQFKSAIDKFTEAQAVAPNNPLIAMDLANAELGAGYYARAETDIRAAFSSDAALLMARYDLKGLIGDDRLQVLIGDLKDLASKSDSPTPVFLLAYLSYNTGDAAKAVEYLNLAETRAGGHDDLIRQLSDHWQLPANKK